MNFFQKTRSLTDANKSRAVAELLENAKPDHQYYLLVIAAILLAASGILVDSIPLLIGSMLVAPLTFPILGLGLGVASNDKKLTLRSFGMLAVSIIIAFALSALGGFLAVSVFHHHMRSVFIGFSPNYFFDIFVAVVSGALATYGLLRAKVGSAMTGIGIAVSLMPPLVATGLGLFTMKIVSGDAFIIFVLNVVGILVASVITFWIISVRSK